MIIHETPLCSLYYAFLRYKGENCDRRSRVTVTLDAASFTAAFSWHGLYVGVFISAAFSVL